MWTLRCGIIGVVAMIGSVACERRERDERLGAEDRPGPNEPASRPLDETRAATERGAERADERAAQAEEHAERMKEKAEQAEESSEERSSAARGESPTSERLPVAGRSIAVSAITEARCEREQKCDNVGADKKYGTMQACMTEVRKEWQEDLEARECTGGVVQKELNECLQEIRNEGCGNPFDTLSRVAACRESDICKATENR